MCVSARVCVSARDAYAERFVKHMRACQLHACVCEMACASCAGASACRCLAFVAENVDSPWVYSAFCLCGFHHSCWRRGSGGVQPPAVPVDHELERNKSRSFRAPLHRAEGDAARSGALASAALAVQQSGLAAQQCHHHHHRRLLLSEGPSRSLPAHLLIFVGGQSNAVRLLTGRA
jgi:hypothetical protein